MIRADIRLCLGEHARHVYESLIPEASGGPTKGNVDIEMEDECIIIRVYSDSFSGARALINSMLLLAHASYSALTTSASSTASKKGNTGTDRTGAGM